MATKKMTGLAAKAVADARSVTELAMEAAKNQLVEGLADPVRKLLAREARARVRAEDVDRLRRAGDGHMETEFEEGVQPDVQEKKMAKDDKDLEKESIMGMFPALAEGEEEELPEASDIPALGEAADDDGDMDETIEISESELDRQFEAFGVTEAQVSKGFKDMSAMGELDDVDPAAGIADVKSGEAEWEKVEPPAAQDYQVKESFKKLVRAGLTENKNLRLENKKLRGLLERAVKEMRNMSLFNAKVQTANAIIRTNEGLSRQRQRAIVEAIDAAESISEVKKISAAVKKTLQPEGKRAGKVNESKARGARVSSGVTRAAAADRNAVEGAANGSMNETFERWSKLAKIIG